MPVENELFWSGLNQQELSGHNVFLGCILTNETFDALSILNEMLNEMLQTTEIPCFNVYIIYVLTLKCVHVNSEQPLLNSLHRLLICEIGGLDC